MGGLVNDAGGVMLGDLTRTETAIIECHRKNPNFTILEIAKAAGCSRSFTSVVGRRFELIFPKDLVGGAQRRKANRVIESEVELAVVAIAEKRGWLVRKMRWIGRDGAPDRFFVRNGVIILPEFKRPHGEPRVLQTLELKRLRRAGVNCPVIDTIEQGKRIFE